MQILLPEPSKSINHKVNQIALLGPGSAIPEMHPFPPPIPIHPSKKSRMKKSSHPLVSIEMKRPGTMTPKKSGKAEEVARIEAAKAERAAEEAARRQAAEVEQARRIALEEEAELARTKARSEARSRRRAAKEAAKIEYPVEVPAVVAASLVPESEEVREEGRRREFARLAVVGVSPRRRRAEQYLKELAAK